MARLLASTARYRSSQEDWMTEKLRQERSKSLSRSIVHRSFGTSLHRQHYRSVCHCLHRSSEDSDCKGMDPRIGRVRESICVSRTYMHILGHSFSSSEKKQMGVGHSEAMEKIKFIEAEIAEAVNDAGEICETKSESDCASAWDMVEELSAARSHLLERERIARSGSHTGNTPYSPTTNPASLNEDFTKLQNPCDVEECSPPTGSLQVRKRGSRAALESLLNIQVFVASTRQLGDWRACLARMWQTTLKS